MTTYNKTSIVWDKASYAAMPASAISAIATKVDAMILAGTMHEQQGFTAGENTSTVLNRFTNRASAEEWIAFNDVVASENNIIKISSRIVDVTHND